MTEAHSRRAWAEVDLDAVRHNAAALLAVSAPARLCAVVKADGYGHGAVAVGRAALEGGAEWLAVAVVDEGVALRAGGIHAPVLLLSEPPPDAMEEAVARGLTPTVYTTAGVEALSRAVALRARAAVGVHVKVDTGMHRVGADPGEAAAVARAVSEAPGLRLEGFWTHCAVADEQDNPFTDLQITRFEEARDALARAGLAPELLHAANSAAAIAHPASRYDLVRCGIAIYGYPPAPTLAGLVDLWPALSLKAEVAHVRVLEAGEGVSYGLRWVAPIRTEVATVPLGYADGVSRRWSHAGGEVLIGGRRRPLAGSATMDQVMVDCGPESGVQVGDEVVFIGAQGDEMITADEWAAAVDTISYEVLCGIGPRVPRVYRGERGGAGEQQRLAVEHS